VVIFWVVGVCGVPLWQYLAIVYLGTSVLLLRSFYEHRAAERPEARTAIVEATFPFGVLFLFNNLHAAHHARPELPWYKLPTFYRAHRTTILAANRGFYFRSYGEIVCRYWRRPNYFPVHPDTRRRNRTHAAG
jgi:fatty acid desaturase